MAARLCAASALIVSCALANSPLAIHDPPRGDVRLVILGDFNGPYGSLDYPAPLTRALLAVVDVWRPDLLLSPGDVIAGQSRDLPDDRFRAMWAAFDATVAEPLRSAGIGYAVALGNHDASSLKGSGGAYLFERERRAAADYWSEHRPDLAFHDDAGYPFDHSFTAHGLFVVVLDASSATVTAEQRSWLATELASRAAVESDARIVIGHLPLVPISTGRDAPGEYVHDGEGLAAVLLAGSVDVYVSGHHAAYYPGRLGDVELLFAGGVGGRRLLGSDAAPRSTVTIVDVWLEPGASERQAAFTYTTFDLAGMTVVDPSELPARVGSVVVSSRAGSVAVAEAGE